MTSNFRDGACYIVIGPVTWEDTGKTEYHTIVVDPSLGYDPDIDPDDDEVLYVAESAGEVFDLVANRQDLYGSSLGWVLNDITCVKYMGDVYEGAAAWDMLEQIHLEEINA